MSVVHTHTHTHTQYASASPALSVINIVEATAQYVWSIIIRQRSPLVGQLDAEAASTAANAVR